MPVALNSAESRKNTNTIFMRTYCSFHPLRNYFHLKSKLYVNVSTTIDGHFSSSSFFFFLLLSLPLNEFTEL